MQLLKRLLAGLRPGARNLPRAPAGADAGPDAARVSERASLEQRLRAAPDDAGLNCDLGDLLVEQGDAETALDCYTLALHYQPALYRACFGRVRCLRLLGRAREEGEAWQRLLQNAPGHAQAAVALACWHYGRGELEDAVVLLQPHCAEERFDREAAAVLGLVLGREYARFDESVALLERALREDPEWPVARCNLGLMLAERGDYDRGLAHIEALLAADPDDQETRYIRACMNLKRGRFREGWADFDARHHSRLAIPRPYAYPRWAGTDAPGSALLIYGEQGIGDQIMFASCFEEAMRRVGRCVIECNPKLVPLFARSFPGARVVASAAAAEDGVRSVESAGRIDLQAAMGDLPGFFRSSLESFPRHTGYLRAAPGRVAAWRERLAALGPGPSIGLSWRGGMHSTRQQLRSMSLAQLAPLLAMPATFVSLQYDDCRDEIEALARTGGPAPLHWQDAIDDYDETAALVCALDAVITVCTAVAHLAGALGRPTWIMTPVVPEWRYLDRGSALPWYPSARLFRQEAGGDWRPVVAAVQRELAALRDT